MDPSKCFSLVFLCLNTISMLVSNEEVAEVAPVLKIEQGFLKGATGSSRDGRPFYKFLGVPYGQVERRFLDSVPAPNWTGVYDSSQFGAECAQRHFGGDENCLHLNVFTPKLKMLAPNELKLPVLFFLHGGGFVFGSSNIYGAEYWMDEDCVIVTINYRLGVLGFLNLDVEGAPGNQGLKDMVLALKWVQLNIAIFNGDKNKVTIFGESAGAAAVSYLILSPLTKGLFHRAISQSGAAHPACTWAWNPDGVVHGRALTAKLKCFGSSDEILDCLQSLDVQDLFDAYPEKMISDSDEADILTSTSFIPSLESRPANNNSIIFLSKPALQIYEEGTFQKVPWIVGANDYEGFLLHGRLLQEKFKTSHEFKTLWAKVGPELLSIETRADRAEISEKVRKFYFDERIDIAENFTNLVADRGFFVCVKMAAERHAQKSPVYLYMFDKQGGFSLLTKMLHLGPHLRPTHADELTYQWKFNSELLDGESDIGLESELYNFSKKFVKMWFQFADTGKPSSQWNSKKVTWESLADGPPSRSSATKWFHINTDSGMELEDRSFEDRLKFWRDLNI